MAGTISCTGKVRFASQATAKRAAIRRIGRCTYHCEFCKGWHVGTVKATRPARIDMQRKLQAVAP
jgi:hypothetical protein